ncbi:MAG TPA: site-specific integrase [Thermodesulfovibrionia bacterium]|nr:site-specific integrase [Thermodesulfovibrionia bacterium]
MAKPVNHIVPVKISPPVLKTPQGSFKAFTDDELSSIVRAFENWLNQAKGQKQWKLRARHWIVFLLLRYTGARVSEVLAIDDIRDMDFRQAEIRLITLKRHSKNTQYRTVPVPPSVIGETGRILADAPELRGRLFKTSRVSFFRHFQSLAAQAGIPEDLRHPHTLRHTRAIEMLRAGVPITVVQDILGHSALTTTAMYLKLSGQEAKAILKDRGLI